MSTPTQSSGAEHFDAVVIGTGFGSLFFTERLRSKRPNWRVLMLERGADNPLGWQIQNAKNSPVNPMSTFENHTDHKIWNFTIGLGGGTNCWFAQTPRFHPSDFKLKTLYGQGRDWPVDYDTLEPYYVEAEQRMAVSGAPEMARILPRSAPFPLPPHNVSAVDRAMMAAQPDLHFPIATARASIATETRGRCCATARCSLCPVNAKFNYDNGFRGPLAGWGVDLRTGCEVTHLDGQGDRITAVRYRDTQGIEHRVTGDLVVLGANAIHSPAILLRSGINQPGTGEGLHEQLGYYAEADLKGLQNFDGSTLTTGLNYSLYDGPWRREHGAALIYFENRWNFGLRTEPPGRWREIAPLTIVVEDLPQATNKVTVDGEGRTVVSHEKASDYAESAVKASFERLSKVLAPLPVEAIHFRRMRDTESHVQGTLRMGTDASDSVVDANLVHHKYRNLVVVGSSVFPTGPCANPSLTVAALSIRSADRVL